MSKNIKVSLNKNEFIKLCNKLFDTENTDEIFPDKTCWHFGRCEIKLVADILYNSVSIPKQLE